MSYALPKSIDARQLPLQVFLYKWLILSKLQPPMGLKMTPMVLETMAIHLMTLL